MAEVVNGNEKDSKIATNVVGQKVNPNDPRRDR
jgi:hypothetical protein